MATAPGSLAAALVPQGCPSRSAWPRKCPNLFCKKAKFSHFSRTNKMQKWSKMVAGNHTLKYPRSQMVLIKQFKSCPPLGPHRGGGLATPLVSNNLKCSDEIIPSNKLLPHSPATSLLEPIGEPALVQDNGLQATFIASQATTTPGETNWLWALDLHKHEFTKPI